MNNFCYYSPTKYVFGKGEENNVGTYLTCLLYTSYVQHWAADDKGRARRKGRGYSAAGQYPMWRVCTVGPKRNHGDLSVDGIKKGAYRLPFLSIGGINLKKKRWTALCCFVALCVAGCVGQPVSQENQTGAERTATAPLAQETPYPQAEIPVPSFSACLLYTSRCV